MALGAYAILFTINPDLLNTDIEIGTAEVTVNISDSVAQTPANGRYANGVADGTPLTGAIPPKCTTNTQTGCLPLFVTLNNSGKECATVGETGCTSTRGLNMSQLRAVQWGCGCSLVLSGGTEWWLHGGTSGRTNHQSGGTTVDIRTNSTNTVLNNYLSGGTPLVHNKIYQSPVGPVIYETNHWHIGS